MILDNECILVAGQGFDLETIRPGPGEEIRMAVVNNSVINDGVVTGPIAAGAVAITTGADATEAEAATTALMTVNVTAGENAYFTLPANAQQFIAVTAFPTNAIVVVILEPGQTNK